MPPSATPLSPSKAAEHLGVSTKALRLYEQHGSLKPGRTAAGWRSYGPAEMQRAAEIATLRALGFSITQIGRVLRGDAAGMEAALAAHQAVLEQRIRCLPMLPRLSVLLAPISRKATKHASLARSLKTFQELFLLDWSALRTAVRMPADALDLSSHAFERNLGLVSGGRG